ncbi:MAG: hypothetical protein H5U33_19610, partial [Pseudomonas sp.]|nr:hypothetical protein [Pseudomonas sp.]
MAQVKRIRRNVSGIILLDKPLGFTSNAALQKVRWLLNAEKAGHTGSLDPLGHARADRDQTQTHGASLF